MEYLTIVEMSEIWDIKSRRSSVLCADGRIDGVMKKGKTWLIPADTKKHSDAQYKKNREGSNE